jgi:hypothetical protein
MVDEARLSSLFRFALTAASQEDSHRELGPIHLLKYAYLGDLAFAEQNEGRTFTGVPWRFHHFGPWSSEAFAVIEPALEGTDARRQEIRAPSGEDRWRWLLDDELLYEQLFKALPSVVAQTVKRAVHDFGNDTASLLHHVYLTPPMRRAAPGENLDFAEAAKAADDRRADARATEPKPPKAHLSTREKKRRAELLRRIREEVRAALHEVRPRISVSPPIPRYDEVFWNGLEWLEELAGKPIEPHSGEISISSGVWKSPSRRDPGIP